MRIGAVIVSAGMSSRMKNFKPMLPLGNTTIIGRELMTLKEAGVQPIVIVTGNNHEALETHIEPYGVQCIYNAYYETTEMFDSVKLGLQAIANQCDYTFFLPVDVPLFSVVTLRQMIQKAMKTKADLLRPKYCNKYGHPILIRSQVIPEILTYEGDQGLKGALSELKGKKRSLEIFDRGITIDADTPEDYEKIISYTQNDIELEELTCKVGLSIRKGTMRLAPEVIKLLQSIDERGSLQLACEANKMSYTKAWKLIKGAEETLHIKLLYRKIGGNNGGGSILTYEARTLITTYLSFEKDLQDYANKLFKKYFLK